MDVAEARLKELSVPYNGVYSLGFRTTGSPRSELPTSHFCHVRCNMTPSMKAGIYHVYLLLGKEGQLATIDKATCECAAG